MKRPEEVLQDFVRQWMRKAHDDLAVARHLMDERPDLGFAVGFHAQQAVEKFIKAVLVRHQIEFPKTHDLERLVELVRSVDEVLARRFRDAVVLTQYAVDARYPGDLPAPTEREARDALARAECIREATLDHLPKELQG